MDSKRNCRLILWMMIKIKNCPPVLYFYCIIPFYFTIKIILGLASGFPDLVPQCQGV